MAVPLPKGEDFGRRRQRKRNTLVLAGLFVLYLVIGGVVFGVLETYEKTFVERQLAPAWSELQVFLEGGNSSSSSNGTAELKTWVTLKDAAVDSCDRAAAERVDQLLEKARLGNTSLQEALLLCGPTGHVTVELVRHVPWTFIDAVFFCMTVITTIGYGHISPSSPGGQVFCIFYSLLGIPISGLLLAGLSDLFAGNLLNFYDSKWHKKYGESRWSLVSFTALYLVAGFLMFVFVPALVFSWLEDWTYLESVYYAFTTLSTIGFGDFTAAVARDDAWTSVYKVLVMLWVLIGLGYWVLVLNFLQKAFKSRELLHTLRQTSHMIAREAEELRSALADAGILHRDAAFVPEHAKAAFSMMLGVGAVLAGDSPPPAGRQANGGVRGIHAMGASLRHNTLLSALLASVPAAALTDAPSALSQLQQQQAEPLLTRQAEVVVTQQAEPLLTRQAEVVVTQQAEPLLTRQAEVVVTPQADTVVTPRARAEADVLLTPAQV